MIVLIDNYDSFVYNVYQYLCELGARVKVIRNDQTTVAKIKRMRPEAVVLSPGPGTPEDAGVCVPIVQELGEEIPILGICLGHQSIASAFGAKIVRARSLYHGKTSLITHKKTGLFKGTSSPLEVVRYHSLVVAPSSLPKCLRVTAQTEGGIIMGIKHRRLPIYGVQFHPESYATGSGFSILENFLNLI